MKKNAVDVLLMILMAALVLGGIYMLFAEAKCATAGYPTARWVFLACYCVRVEEGQTVMVPVAEVWAR